jgi:hypothetical protein
MATVVSIQHELSLCLYNENHRRFIAPVFQKTLIFPNLHLFLPGCGICFDSSSRPAEKEQARIRNPGRIFRRGAAHKKKSRPGFHTERP